MEHSDPTPQAVASTVRDAMDAGGHTLRSVSAATGIPMTTLQRRLAGTHPGFTTTELALVAGRVLKTPLSRLLAQAEARSAA